MNYTALRFADTDAHHLLLSETATLGYEARDGELIAYFDSATDITNLLPDSLVPPETVPAEDWNRKWKEHHRPIRVGPFHIRAPWMEQTRLEHFSHNGLLHEIVIEPGMAFGTGAHETTRACLAFIGRLLRPGDAFLDMGAGSGILSIAAGKLGATRIVAVDCDPVAVETGRLNAVNNGVRVNFVTADRPPAGKFDVVVANIQSSVIESIIGDLLRAVRPGGHLVIAGLLDNERVSFEKISSSIVMRPWRTLHIVKE